MVEGVVLRTAPWSSTATLIAQHSTAGFYSHHTASRYTGEIASRCTGEIKQQLTQFRDGKKVLDSTGIKSIVATDSLALVAYNLGDGRVVHKRDGREQVMLNLQRAAPAAGTKPCLTFSLSVSLQSTPW